MWKNKLSRYLFFALGFMALWAGLAPGLYAADQVVENLDDTGTGSLRGAIAAVGNGETITFSDTLTEGTITLESALTVDKDMTIQGPSDISITITANSGAFSVFNINAGVTAEITHLNVTGSTNSGISNSGTLTLKNCAIFGNSSSGNGGGVNNGGTLTLINCTVSGNSAVGGGGISNSGALTTLYSCTVTNNTASGTMFPYNGGGIYNGLDFIGDAGTLTVKNTILADNTASPVNANDYHGEAGNVTSLGNNLIGVGDFIAGLLPSDSAGSPTDELVPMLDPLGNNGGPTQTHALQSGSPAINAGADDPTYAPLDQRGYTRDGITDIGAYEYGGNPPVPEINIQQEGTDIPHSSGTFDFGSAGISGTGITQTFTIQNVGWADLSLTGSSIVSKSGTDADDFTVNENVTLATVGAQSSTTFDVTFTPSTLGAKTATLSIASDDSDENPYIFTVTGTGAASEIQVSQGGTVLESGAGEYDFGPVNLGTTSPVISFTIENNGGIPLGLTGDPKVAASGTDVADFSVDDSATAASVAAGASTGFTVQFQPSSIGNKTATISIPNDSEPNPYTFTVIGSSGVPEFSLRQGSTDIPSGKSHDFGNVLVGSSSQPVTFTIENIGGGQLELTGDPDKIKVFGQDAVYFSVEANAVTSPLGANDSTLFTVSFTPQETGVKTIIVQVPNNDADESLYAFKIEGNGYLLPDPGDFDGNGTVELKDAILLLMALSDIDSGTPILVEADTDSDGKLGITDVIYVLALISNQ